MTRNIKLPQKSDYSTTVKMQIQTLALLLMLSLLKVDEAAGLSISSIEVPAAVMNSSQVTLICNYDLQGDQLYSVKWYKNYVEFYRFQPPANGNGGDSSHAEGSADSLISGIHSAGVVASDNPTNSKHDFELDGINLNLSRSNSSHVYLRQVTLASDGTYKCEVTADTPAFPTVKMERQMKVYVLPKQKLTIVDNSTPSKVAATSGDGGSHLDRSQPLPSSMTIKTALIYNSNDTVNLTCTSGPSRPQAKISWLLNEKPISPTSKWIHHHQDYSTNEHLVSSQSTLAFKIQPSHLRQQKNGSYDIQGSTTRLLPVRLRCVAKLSFEYFSETSVQASGGKTIMKKRQQQAPVPLASPYSVQSPSHRSYESSASILDQDVSSSSPYRWPRPQASGLQRTRNNPGSFSDAWITSSTSITEATLTLSDNQPSEDHSTLSELSSLSRRYNSPVNNGLAVWTNRQLKAQAEHIDSMLMLLRPNELDTPTIEVSIEQVDGGSAQPNILINASSGANDGELTIDYLKTLSHTEKSEKNSAIKDYELNDVVRFTCQPRFAGRFRSEIYDAGMNIRVKWLINSKEVVSNQIDTFDGQKFYNTRDLPIKTRPPTTNQTSSRTSDTLSAMLNDFYGANTSFTTNQSSNHSLLIEFTPTLFQLKELNIKCYTMIEQTLIEYDSHLTVSATVGQLDQERARTMSTNHRDQSYRNNGRVYLMHGNSNKRQERNKLGSPRSTQSNSATSIPCSILIIVSCFLTQLCIFIVEL